jgi:hypothetical protein
MHLKDELLRALLDQELPEETERQAREHLVRCAECQSRYDTARQQADRVAARMRALAPGRNQQPSPQAAYAQMSKNNRMNSRKKEWIKPMLSRKPVWAALTVLLVLVMALSMPPVRAWASSFLGLFRVENITVITFDPANIEESLDRLETNQEAIEALLKEVSVVKSTRPQTVNSADEAAALAGFSPRLPSNLDGAQFAVKPAASATYTIDRAALQDLFNAVGVDIQLPADVDGETVTVEVKDAIVAAYGCPADFAEQNLPESCTSLIQLPSPTVDAPEGLDVQRMGEAMLQFLGLSPAEARILSQRIDWTSTLIVPVPQGEGVSYREVTVDGVSGTLLQETDRDAYMLLWVKDGMLYGLQGSGNPDQALRTANALQ